MSRTILDPTWAPADVRNYLEVAEFTRPGASYPDIVFSRSDGTDLAVKALTVVVPESAADRFTGLTRLNDIIAALVTVGNQAEIVLLHQERPITFLPWSDDGTNTGLEFNVQVELPGGKKEPGQTMTVTARAELLEEAGIGDVLCSAPLYHGYRANSAGHQKERYAMELIIAIGQPTDTDHQVEEGIVKAYTVSLGQVTAHLDNLARRGYLIEWATLGIDRLLRLILEQQLNAR